jgi:hypothetical protein
LNADYECPDCHREMSIVFIGDGKAYDECECGTSSEVYDFDEQAAAEAFAERAWSGNG